MKITVPPTPAVERYVKAVLQTLVLFIVSAAPAHAQARAATPFDILDNSFLVEEAFNQEAGIFQNIFGVRLDGGSHWEFGFTQEWPVGSQTHQFSYTVPVTGLPGASGFGDVLLHYRYQWWLEGARRPAFSPRLSVILPSGNEQDGRGAGVVGWQVNLPLSKQQGDLYYHWNAGFTWLPGVRASSGADARNLFTPTLGASAIWRARPMFHPMLEAVAEFEDQIVTLSPGFRTGWNITDQQLILGFAVPVTFAAGDRDAAAFIYVSYELPFKR